MKKLIILSLLIFGTAFVSYSQKYGYIDSEYILENMPEYVSAQEELDKFARRWEAEISELYKQIKKRKDEFLRVEAILPEEERLRRSEEIKTMESEALETQQMRFGVTGDL